MKKELLMGTALVSTLGAASIAEAVTATFSGNHKVGVEFESNDSAATDTRGQLNDNNFTVSLEETTDAGVKISSSFMLANEATGSGDDDAGITLTFTDGSKLDLLNAGNAGATHAISVPSSAGAEGVGVTTTNNAPSGLTFMTASTTLGIEYHTASDFLMDGLKASFSYSTDTEAAATATARIDSHFGIGATYVTDAGDSTITIGTGFSSTEASKTGDQLTSDEGGFHIGISAVTGDLTVAAGFADGDSIEDDGAGDNTASTQNDGDVMALGAKYVSGDFTFNVGVVAGESNDSSTEGTAGTTTDAYDKTSASVSYAVASGVTAYLGFSSVDSQDEGTTDTNAGSAWYIGANMSF